jgi:3,4-dihydroxy 2-butanone 4-phosphate synthase / GTP cyclohydrolase II
MPFSPIPEILEEIRAGRMVVIVDDEDRENEGDLIMAAELVRPSGHQLHGHPCARAGLPGADPRALPAAGPAADGAVDNTRAVTAPTSRCRSRRPRASPPAFRPTTARTPSAPPCARCARRRPAPARPHLSADGAARRRAGAHRPHRSRFAICRVLAGLEPAGVLVEILNPDGSMARRPTLRSSRASTASRWARSRTWSLTGWPTSTPSSASTAARSEPLRCLHPAHLPRPAQPRTALRAGAR